MNLVEECMRISGAERVLMLTVGSYTLGPTGADV